MDAWRLGLTAAIGLAAAGLLARVAWGVWRRGSTPALHAASEAHAVGWAMLSTMVASDGLRVALALLGDPAHVGYLFLIYVKIVAASAAFAGFGLYVLTIWAGRTRLIGLIATLAVAHAVAFLVLTTARLPFDVTVGLWATRLQLVGPGVPGVPQGVALLLFFLPTIVIALAYLMLLPRLTDRTHRVRVGLVATALIAFQAAGTVQSNPETDPDGLLVPGFTALLLVAALLSHLAYYPPLVLRRMGLRSIREENHGAPPLRPRPDAGGAGPPVP